MIIMKKIIYLVLLALITGLVAQAHEKTGEWNGCDRYDFTFKDRQATIVVPKKAAKGNPWIWRPAFFDAFPSVDKALLEKGFHIVYYDVTHLYGSPRAVSLGTEFYENMTDLYNLSEKVTLEGFSRGGLFVFNWAAQNTEKVACIYVDAPVCDVFSWPGRKNAALWNDLLKEWNISKGTRSTTSPRLQPQAYRSSVYAVTAIRPSPTRKTWMSYVRAILRQEARWKSS